MNKLAGKRGNIGQLALFNFAHNANRTQTMLIHCIAVIHIKLHHPHNAPEIRHINTQPAGFIHQAQNALGIAFAADKLQENFMGLGSLQLCRSGSANRTC